MSKSRWNVLWAGRYISCKYSAGFAWLEASELKYSHLQLVKAFSAKFIVLSANQRCPLFGKSTFFYLFCLKKIPCYFELLKRIQRHQLCFLDKPRHILVPRCYIQLFKKIIFKNIIISAEWLGFPSFCRQQGKNQYSELKLDDS